jgi:phage terminase large subunit-like protein
METKRRKPKSGEPVGSAGPDGPIRAADPIAFIETVCRVVDGPKIGQPIRLAPFQWRFIEAVHDNAHGPTRRAILSTGRKNSKTRTIACLLLNHLCGPSARNNSGARRDRPSLSRAAGSAPRRSTSLVWVFGPGL